MKTAKVLIFATLLVFTSVSILNAGGFEKQKKTRILNVTLVQALGIPGLPSAMLQQVNEDEVTGCDCAYYTADVTMGNTTYRVTGTKQEWILFFNYWEIMVQEENNVTPAIN